MLISDCKCAINQAVNGGKTPVERIPVDRIMKKEDELFAQKDFAGVERLLAFWLSEAETNGDLQGAFQMQNERMGFYRKMGEEAKAVDAAFTALGLREDAGITKDSTASATCCINAGTVLKAFGRSEESLPLFEEAIPVYEASLKPGDARLGGLYNNYALALTDVGREDEALSFYEKALTVMEACENGALECAMTHLNMCDTLMHRDGVAVNADGDLCSAEDEDAVLSVSRETDEKIAALLDLAFSELLSENIPDNGYKAFVFEKCAPTFSYYGRNGAAEFLRNVSEEISAELKK